jgi:hypothetical protein
VSGKPSQKKRRRANGFGAKSDSRHSFAGDTISPRQSVTKAGLEAASATLENEFAEHRKHSHFPVYLLCLPRA